MKILKKLKSLHWVKALQRMRREDVVAWAQPRLYHLLAPLLALLAVAAFQQTKLSRIAEYPTVKLRFETRAPFDPPADPRLVFVAIDEFSLNHLGKWPWPREDEAQFLGVLANSDQVPHTVAFDVMFTEISDLAMNTAPPPAPPAPPPSGHHHRRAAAPPPPPPPPPESADQKLADAAGLLPSVITGAYVTIPPDQPEVRAAAEKKTSTVLANPGLTSPLKNVRGDINRLIHSTTADLPVAPLLSQSFFAFVNDEPDPQDDIRHTVPFVVNIQGKVFPSLALATVCQMLGVDPDKVDVDLPGHRITLHEAGGKERVIPISEDGLFTINYRKRENFQTVGFAALLQNIADHLKNNTPVNPHCQVGNKTLLIGEEAMALGDHGPTPLDATSPLPLVHLNAINNVLKNDYIRFVPWYWVVLGWCIVTWPTVLRLKNAPAGEAIAAPTAIMVIYTAFAFAIFWAASWQIDLVWPLVAYAAVNFGAIVQRWREERSGREQMKTLFSRMLSKQVMNHLLDNPQNMKLGGTSRVTTILFSDIRDYTKFSEGLSAEEVVRQLNTYFERMVPCVQETEGTLHKYIGDAIMAAWGDIGVMSRGATYDALHAVRCALLMRKRLRELNAERETAGLTPLRIGIGLNQGPVLAGLIGASSRSEFTVIGDAVNTASRLEGITKEFKTDLVISESVRQYLDDKFIVRRLGFIQLKGKTRATVVYDVLGEKETSDDMRMQPDDVARYEKAFSCFLGRRFEEARAGFAACEEKYPDDYCSHNYRMASEEFLTTPPAPDWDGRIVMKTK